MCINESKADSLMPASDVSCGEVPGLSVMAHFTQHWPQGGTGESHFDPMLYRDLLSIVAFEDLKHG